MGPFLRGKIKDVAAEAEGMQVVFFFFLFHSVEGGKKAKHEVHCSLGKYNK